MSPQTHQIVYNDIERACERLANSYGHVTRELQAFNLTPDQREHLKNVQAKLLNARQVVTELLMFA